MHESISTRLTYTQQYNLHEIGTNIYSKKTTVEQTADDKIKSTPKKENGTNKRGRYSKSKKLHNANNFIKA